MKKYYFDSEKMENSPLRQMVKLREEGLNQEFIKGLSE